MFRLPAGATVLVHWYCESSYYLGFRYLVNNLCSFERLLLAKGDSKLFLDSEPTGGASVTDWLKSLF